jgi:hypothetical protein
MSKMREGKYKTNKDMEDGSQRQETCSHRSSQVCKLRNDL